MSQNNENPVNIELLPNGQSLDLKRLVNEFTEKEEEVQPTGVASSAPVPNRAMHQTRSMREVIAAAKAREEESRHQVRSAGGPRGGSWGGRIMVAMFWLVTIGAGSGMAAYHTNPEFRARFDALAKRYLPSGGKSFGEKLADPYKEALAKIETRGTSLEDASRAMGADPTKKLTAADNARFEAQLASASGEKSNVAVDRNRRLKDKFGEGGMDFSKEREALAKEKTAKVPAAR